ncbi:MAG: UbiX family flavin prenyltransferase [Proteobacteria bacterium]|nr:UbiX family flavin prenyltransferase [Pseudomonadota bacterium]MBU1583547.1 UbiX family flavin prenyltransferase [Pseudomonadota bacterium]MBU2455844.1 UbiX family flavin prenyltransferase [Pseudomonadota bacterium]MBU2627856.1 UbiX family flavin prenyltransferase [Pseudomonadota bacterium]
MAKRLIIGIAGASGVIYGVRMLEVLKNRGIETHLIISDAGKLNIKIETDYDVDDVLAMADYTYTNKDIAASVASGSFQTMGMVVAPCTVKTLSGIANSYNENLLIRAADVQLKEKRKLALLFRETPLHIGHLRLLTQAAEMGAHIIPPVPAFYHRPKTIDDIINQSVGKVLDYIGIEHDLFKRWDNSELDKLMNASKNSKTGNKHDDKVIAMK